MSRSDKDNTFVKYRFLKFEAANVYRDTLGFCVYLGRSKFAFQGVLSNLIIKVKRQILKKLAIKSSRNLFI